MTPYNFRGAWSGAATYSAFDTVTSGGSSWVALATVTPASPSVAPSPGASWALLTTPTLWPALPGLTWDVKLAPEFFGQEHKGTTPGYDTETSYGPDPLYHLEMTFSILRDTSVLNERRILQNFFEAMGGRFRSFLLSMPTITQNPADGFVAGQPLIVDANNYAPLAITRPYLNENVYEPAGINGNPGTAPVIYIGGTPQVAGVNYNIIGPPGVATSTASYPASVVWFLSTPGGAVTADINWLYRMRFEQTKQEFNAFMFLLYEANQVQICSTRTQ